MVFYRCLGEFTRANELAELDKSSSSSLYACIKIPTNFPDTLILSQGVVIEPGGMNKFLSFWKVDVIGP